MPRTSRISRMLAAIIAIAILTAAVVVWGGVDAESDAAPADASPAAATQAASEAARTETAREAAPTNEVPDTQVASSPTPVAGETCANCATDASADRTPGQVRASQRVGTVLGIGYASKGGGGPIEVLGAVQELYPSDTTFEDYGRLPFVETSVDAVSTFSLDTDRTSYLLALTWAKEGYGVQPDSVRAEEWVNAFDYRYDPPDDATEFGITSAAAGHPLEDGLHLVRIAFRAPQVPDDTPLNVTLVLDASGSMSFGNRVAIAREAAETIRQSLGERDRIAVVHFTTTVLETLTVEHTTPDDEAVARSISMHSPHGSTNVQAGLNLGVQLADEARRERPDAYNYIILMSDGVANVDATDPFAILDSSPDADSLNPLRLITIGVGLENYNDYLLEQLAQHGNGWYRYLNDIDGARETFSRESWLTLSTPFADQTRAQVTWDPAVVKAWRILGYENRVTPDETFEEDRKEFAEIFATAPTTVFYEVELHPDDGLSKAGDAPLRLGGVELRWVDPASGESRSQQADVSGRTDTGFGDFEDDLFRLGAVVALTADRYSALSDESEDAEPAPASVHADLTVLREELLALRVSLSGRDSYRDFRYLLGELVRLAGEAATSPRSGQ
ncbi:MAG: von Willebrand factor type A domain-containing protein [Chloroflexi bacterium]|nr:von Willebrand factor type A domain-containing protein [Chloroflexota bacterium]